MIYLLDTNACIHHLKFSNSPVTRKLVTLRSTDIAVCSVTKAELFYGAMRSNNPTDALRSQQEFLGRYESLPFDDPAGLIQGRVRAQLAALGSPIGPYDLQIAAIAMANSLTLVTHNVREFSRVEGLLKELVDNQYLPAIAALEDSPRGRSEAQRWAKLIKEHWAAHGKIDLLLR